MNHHIQRASERLQKEVIKYTNVISEQYPNGSIVEIARGGETIKIEVTHVFVRFQHLGVIIGHNFTHGGEIRFTPHEITKLVKKA